MVLLRGLAGVCLLMVFVGCAADRSVQEDAGVVLHPYWPQRYLDQSLGHVLTNLEAHGMGYNIKERPADEHDGRRWSVLNRPSSCWEDITDSDNNVIRFGDGGSSYSLPEYEEHAMVYYAAWGEVVLYLEWNLFERDGGPLYVKDMAVTLKPWVELHPLTIMRPLRPWDDEAFRQDPDRREGGLGRFPGRSGG